LAARPIPLSFGVLAAIGDHGASTPELVEMLGRGQMFWTSSPSQIYAEPKRLLSLGWISAQKEPGRTRPRTVYTLTSEGRRALQAWLRAPTGFPKLQHQAALHLFAGDMIADHEIVASLQKLRADIEQMKRAVEVNIARAPQFPHRTRYALLLQDLGNRLLEAHSEWLDGVESALGSPRARGAGRERREP
jgi:PadR family transcriptional regulator, regulatory protein AphA